MLVSVIVPVRDGARFLGEAIASVLAQDHPHELIVVDDGSTDGSAAIARAFPGVTVLARPPQGVAAARNAGLAEAKGDLIAFLDADDLYVPDRFRQQAAILAAHLDVQYVLGRLVNFLEPGLAMPAWFAAEAQAKDRLGFVTSGLFRRGVFDLVGPFDPSFGTGEDIDWLVRARERGLPSLVLDDVVLRRRIHDANASADVAGGHARLLAILQASVQRRRQATS